MCATAEIIESLTKTAQGHAQSAQVVEGFGMIAKNFGSVMWRRLVMPNPNPAKLSEEMNAKFTREMDEIMEKQASSEIAGKSMNKSEIAEKAAREITHYFLEPEPRMEQHIKPISAIVERAIAEGQVPQSHKCPKCGEPLQEVRYPSDSPLNRDQWESQLAGNLFCTCHNNHRGNKPYAYFWKHEFESTELGDGEPSPPPVPIRESRTHWLTKDLTAEERAKLGGMKFEKSGSVALKCPKCGEGVTFEVAIHLGLEPPSLPLFVACGICNHYIGNFAQLPLRSGAAQEVSPPSPEPTMLAEICIDCGHEFGVWFAENPVWNEIIPGRVGMLCPCCFIVRAEKRGFHTTGWKMVPMDNPLGEQSVEQEPIPLQFVDEFTKHCDGLTEVDKVLMAEIAALREKP